MVMIPPTNIAITQINRTNTHRVLIASPPYFPEDEETPPDLSKSYLFGLEERVVKS